MFDSGEYWVEGVLCANSRVLEAQVEVEDEDEDEEDDVDVSAESVRGKEAVGEFDLVEKHE